MRSDPLTRMTEDIDHELRARGLTRGYGAYAGALPLDAVITPETLCVAAHVAARGMRDRPDTRRYLSCCWASSVELADRVLDGRFRPSHYATRTIRERGKARVIQPPTFESKVVQKTLCALCVRPALVHHMAAHSYAGIPGRGCHLMWADVEDALTHALRTGDALVAVTFDYRSYFASIPREGLLAAVGHHVTGDGVMGLVALFFPDERGCSLGNELSQVPASFYPSPVDHWMACRLGLPWFRYMDDSLGICRDNDAERVIADHVRLADGLGLALPAEKTHVTDIGRDLAFCKERFHVDRDRERYVRLPNPRRESRERRTIRAMGRAATEGEAAYEDLVHQATGVLGTLAAEPHTARMRQRLADELLAQLPR